MSGTSASKRLEITDELAATDLDTAMALRLLHFDNERKLEEMKAQAKLIAYEVSKMFGSGEQEETETVEW